MITWKILKAKFLDKFFPEDVQGKKEIEFLELKQGSSMVAEYNTKFEELIRFCPHHDVVDFERSKCLKFVNGLRPEIKATINCHQIVVFSNLVNKCVIFDEDNWTRSSHYKSLNDRKGKVKFRGTPYVTPAYKGKQKATFDRKPSRGGTPSPLRCFKCGVEGHRASECTSVELKCFKCGKLGHKASE